MQICWYLRKDSQFIKRSSAWQGCWIEGKSQCEVKEIKQIFKFKIINLWWYVLNYHYFIALFREVVESKVDDPRRKLTRLIKYTSGDARELIKHCIQLPSKEGFKHAKYLLEKVYGSPHKTLASYWKWKIDNQLNLEMQLLLDSSIISCKDVKTWQQTKGGTH